MAVMRSLMSPTFRYKESSMTVITGAKNIAMYRLLTLRSALKLEIVGLKASRGRSAYALIKREFGLKGSKQRVLEQFEEYIRQESAVG
jgi:hypothetical protein